MNPRLNQQPENELVSRINQLDTITRELKTGVQYAEASMYQFMSGSAYDISGALATSSIANQVVALVIITATSVDNASFLSTFAPELYIPDMNTPYNDKLTNAYGVTYNKIVTDDVTKTQFWFSIVARTIGTPASNFYLKAHIFASAPVTVSFARQI